MKIDEVFKFVLDWREKEGNKLPMSPEDMTRLCVDFQEHQKRKIEEMTENISKASYRPQPPKFPEDRIQTGGI